MHTFIFPKQDTFITNETGYADKNFGIDEILELKAQNQLISNVAFYTSASLSGSYSTFDVLNYIGSVSGSYISGAAGSSNIYVSGSSQFTSTNYNGQLPNKEELLQSVVNGININADENELRGKNRCVPARFALNKTIAIYC